MPPSCCLLPFACTKPIMILISIRSAMHKCCSALQHTASTARHLGVGASVLVGNEPLSGVLALGCVRSKLCSLTLDEHTQCGHVNSLSLPINPFLTLPDVAAFPHAAFPWSFQRLPWYFSITSSSTPWSLQSSQNAPMLQANCHSYLPRARIRLGRHRNDLRFRLWKRTPAR